MKLDLQLYKISDKLQIKIFSLLLREIKLNPKCLKVTLNSAIIDFTKDSEYVKFLHKCSGLECSNPSKVLKECEK